MHNKHAGRKLWRTEEAGGQNCKTPPTSKKASRDLPSQINNIGLDTQLRFCLHDSGLEQRLRNWTLFKVRLTLQPLFLRKGKSTTGSFNIET